MVLMTVSDMIFCLLMLEMLHYIDRVIKGEGSSIWIEGIQTL